MNDNLWKDTFNSDIDTLIELWEMPNGEDEISRDAKAEIAKIRYELSELREQLEKVKAERDALKAKADISVCAWCGQECKKDQISISEHVMACEKRPEKILIEDILKLHDVNVQQASRLDAAHLPDMIDNLDEIMDFVFKNEPCGYYCDEAVGHVDHKYTNWLKSIIGDLRMLSGNAVK